MAFVYEEVVCKMKLKGECKFLVLWLHLTHCWQEYYSH